MRTAPSVDVPLLLLDQEHGHLHMLSRLFYSANGRGTCCSSNIHSGIDSDVLDLWLPGNGELWTWDWVVLICLAGLFCFFIIDSNLGDFGHLWLPGNGTQLGILDWVTLMNIC